MVSLYGPLPPSTTYLLPRTRMTCRTSKWAIQLCILKHHLFCKRIRIDKTCKKAISNCRFRRATLVEVSWLDEKRTSNIRRIFNTSMDFLESVNPRQLTKSPFFFFFFYCRIGNTSTSKYNLYQYLRWRVAIGCFQLITVNLPIIWEGGGSTPLPYLFKISG